MPLWTYWALFFAVIGLSLLAAAWLDARYGAMTAPSAARPAPAFERPAARAVKAIEPPARVDPFAPTLEIERALVLGAVPSDTQPAKREDDGPTRE